MNSSEINYRKTFIRNSLGHLETMRGTEHDAALFAALRSGIRRSVAVVRRIEAA